MKTIIVRTEVEADLDKVWEYWNSLNHITGWAFASDEWECPYAENDIEEGGKFITRMCAKDRSSSFDLCGTYTTVIPQENIQYTLDDGREVKITFEKVDDTTQITEEFQMEDENSEAQQKEGWQAILENFKYYTEQN